MPRCVHMRTHWTAGTSFEPCLFLALLITSDFRRNKHNCKSCSLNFNHTCFLHLGRDIADLCCRYLAEIGALDVLNGDDTPLPLSDMYRKLAEDTDRHRCSWGSFQDYRHLKFLGYIVGCHSGPWSMQKVKIKFDDQSYMFDNLHLGETRSIFDVYPPNSKNYDFLCSSICHRILAGVLQLYEAIFKLFNPFPGFALCNLNCYPPSKQEIEDLERHCNGRPLKFCIVEHGHASFLSFTKVELPGHP
ncbi:hypothetical protein CDL12_28107 [Handroanthus impetiginosus]|uniref:Uncharacterized protein n=1 Tax=Handroanthus impetiginosus TaxID=429701 RepID=A0A2G9G253_9LAMI|nr:hypothetical protein CDL12_28107 [Handroanthus impetiginosus]